MVHVPKHGRFPFGTLWGRVHPLLHTPLWASVAVAVLSLLPFFYSDAITVLVTGATGLIYLSYFMNNLASFFARLRGWPHEKAPFSLGRWGMSINVLALVYGGLMIVNFLWFGGLRSSTNPALSGAFPALGSFSLLGNIPIFEFSLLVLFIVGAIYWFGFKRRTVVANGEKAAEALAD